MQSRILESIAWDNHHDTWIIRIDYSKWALNEAKIIENNWINDQAKNRIFQEWISIDWVESLDLDDAIWVEKTSKWYTVFVHISDVTEAIPTYSELDIEALKRTTSIYRQEWVINMVPPILSQNILSLNEDWIKLTLTLQIDLDINWNIKKFDVFESKFKNMKRYNYEDFVDDYLNPDCERHENLHLMYEVARKRRNIRKSMWASMDFDDAERQLHIWSYEEKQHYSRKKIPSTIIEEFMILANIASATISVKNWYNSIFRLHDALSEKAYYHNFVWEHKWLALQNYTHFTSPIRRYADMVVHRVLKWLHIRWEESPYTALEIADISHHINISRTVIDILGKDTEIELKWKKIVSKLKARNWDILNTSHFTQSIRDIVWKWKKMPKVVVWEIINDLENWDKSDWGWAIWVLLVWKDTEIKKSLKRVLLNNENFSPKSVLSLLNVTKILNTDEDFLFEISEQEIWNQFSIIVKFKWKELFRKSINYWKISRETAVWKIRSEILNKIVVHFCGK